MTTARSSQPPATWTSTSTRRSSRASAPATPPGLSISRATTATAVVVSQSAVVRVFSRGKLKAEIIPELFLMSRERLFTPDAAVQRVPELGLTVAVADADADADA